MQPYQCVIFDFAFTLCSDKYFRALGPEWEQPVDDLLFGDSDGRWAGPWMAGELSSDDIIDHLARNLPFTHRQLRDALHAGCSAMTFNPGVWAFARQQRAAGRKTALVTINADCFSSIVVPAHGLADAFDVVINSADQGTTVKETLWRAAFDRLGPPCSFATSLLIDDAVTHVERFRSLGGQALLYIDDPSFLRRINAEAQADSEGPGRPSPI